LLRHRTAHLLDQARSRRGEREGGLRVLTTGDAAKVGPVVRRLWDEPVDVTAVQI